ncbi:unnamed protein product, partial [Ectocarpus sp. 13 AM-2016]
MGPKKKKSKAQKEAERLQAEEEERKAEILRAKREAERIRKEAEDVKILKEEQIADRTEELERLSNELQEAQDQIAETKERLRRAEKLEVVQSSWETYTKCDPRPDAASEKALNTFLSQGADEEVPELEQAMERCVYGESIAADLLNDIGLSLENGDISRMARNEKFLEVLRGLS